MADKQTQPVTSKDAEILFYDLESLSNVFTCAVWRPSNDFAPNLTCVARKASTGKRPGAPASTW